MGQIHRELLKHEDVLRFVSEAERFCDLFDKLDGLPKAYFLQQLDELLPLVYSLAHRLPDPYNWVEIEADDTWESNRRSGMELPDHVSSWKEWDARLREKPNLMYGSILFTTQYTQKSVTSLTATSAGSSQKSTLI
jgi:hypothetical protein